MSKKLTNCKACDNEVAKSAKVCPHCGKKLKSGWILKSFFALVILTVMISLEGEPSREDVVPDIITATAIDVTPFSKSMQSFKMKSKKTDIQKENIASGIVGKVVQWSLPLDNIEKKGDFYEVVTKDSFPFEAMTTLEKTHTIIPAVITLYPQNKKEIDYIESLSENQTITVKGKVTSISALRVLINPAVIIME